jgi:hypothetical protein
MTAKPVLNSSVCVSTMLNNVPVVVTGAHMGNVGLFQPKDRLSPVPRRVERKAWVKRQNAILYGRWGDGFAEPKILGG